MAGRRCEARGRAPIKPVDDRAPAPRKTAPIAQSTRLSLHSPPPSARAASCATTLPTAPSIAKSQAPSAPLRPSGSRTSTRHAVLFGLLTPRRGRGPRPDLQQRARASTGTRRSLHLLLVVCGCVRWPFVCVEARILHSKASLWMGLCVSEGARDRHLRGARQTHPFFLFAGTPLPWFFLLCVRTQKATDVLAQQLIGFLEAVKRLQSRAGGGGERPARVCAPGVAGVGAGRRRGVVGGERKRARLPSVRGHSADGRAAP